MTNRAAVFAYLDTLGECQISGRILPDIVAAMNGKRPYHSTCLDACRDYAGISGGAFECVDNQKSIYHFTPGVRLGNAIVD